MSKKRKPNEFIDVLYNLEEIDEALRDIRVCLGELKVLAFVSTIALVFIAVTHFV